MRFRFPSHPLVLLVGGIVLAMVLTWIVPAGEYDRRDDLATGKSVVVAGTYHPVPRQPVGAVRGRLSAFRRVSSKRRTSFSLCSWSVARSRSSKRPALSGGPWTCWRTVCKTGVPW